MSGAGGQDDPAGQVESVRQLVGGVTHDLNNLLTSITALSTLALRDLGADHPNHRDLVEIASAAQRASMLTRQLVEVARGQHAPPASTAHAASATNVDTSLDAVTIEGNETILVAEDDPSIRRLVARVLERAGYTVQQAESADEALSLALELDGRLDLLLTDVVMPGGSGETLYARIQAQWPGVRVLYMSGYTDSAVVRREAEEPGGAYLPKPFAPEVLLATVRRVLDREPQSLADR